MKGILALAFAAATLSIAAQPKVVSATGPKPVNLDDQVRVDVQPPVPDTKRITLWINGIDSEIAPDGIAPLGANRQAFTFRLARTAENTELWRDVLHDPFDGKSEPILLSVGVTGDKPLPLADGVTPLKLRKAYVAPEGVISAIVFVIALVLLFRLKSDMLRNGPAIDGKKQAYSLGRSQMAWWFIVVLASFITIWLITGDRDTITTSSLVLMGISAATAMGSIAIEASAPARANDARKQLEAEKESLAASPSANSDAVQLRVKEIDQTVANVMQPPMTTGSWLRDVLSDNNGLIALHRFQILVWTLILGVIFVTSVLRDLSMPQFNTTLLALMGISAGTYLGFKLPTNGG